MVMGFDTVPILSPWVARASVPADRQGRRSYRYAGWFNTAVAGQSQLSAAAYP